MQLSYRRELLITFALFSGTGKTYTMLGTSRDPGIMVLTLNSLFEQIHATEEDNIFRVTMSYLEVFAHSLAVLLFI